MSAENILLSKLNEFTRKYYINSIIRGALLTLGLLLSCFLLEIFLEYFSYFPSVTRFILVYSYVGVAIVSVGALVVRPWLKYLRIGKTLTPEEAAGIIGEHFREISDKLINTLQLIEQKDRSPENIDLLVASIEQRIHAIQPLPFTKVINLNRNLRYLKFILPPVLILLLCLLIAPSMISDPTRRLILYSEKFSPPALFRIVILNKELSAMQQDDFNLRIELRGNEIPEEVFVKTGNSTFPMKRENSLNYSYVFKALQENTGFTLLADGKESVEYKISVFPKPIILNFEANIEYPVYTGKQNEKLDNIGDFIIPEGTRITWTVNTRDVTKMKFRMQGGEIQPGQKKDNVFTFARRFMESIGYCVFQENQHSAKSDSLIYSVTVIKDAFPEISLTEQSDTGHTGKLFLQGSIKDDYGFNRLVFNLSRQGMNDSTFTRIKSENLVIDKKNCSQLYLYALDLSDVELNPGDKYSYYFEVWDNDGIHGPKAARTFPQIIEIPSLEKIAENTDKNSESIQKDLSQSLKESRDIGKSLDEINKRMIDQNEISWKEKKKLEDVIKANENIQKQVEEFKSRNEQNLKNEQQYLETSERILEKQKKLNELANQLLTEEIKKTIQEMKDLLNKMDKAKLSELLPKVKQMNEDLEKELDRNLELFRQIEFERKLEQTTKDLKSLAGQQQKLAEKTEIEKNSNAQITSKQEEIEQKYDSIKNSLDKLQKQGEQLENAPDIKSTEDERKKIGEMLDSSNELIKKNKMKDASGNQKKTSQQMSELAQKLEESQEESEDEAQEEDAQALRLLLQNLNKLSFQQEDLIYRTRDINRNDPKYLQLIEDQKIVKDKFKTVEDTLNRIARRQVMMKSIIMKEVTEVKENLNLSEKSLLDRVLPTAMARQQYSMTSMNNLAMLLDEALQQMNQEQQSSSSKSGKKSCSRPSKSGKSGGKKKMSAMRQMQEEMSSKLDKLRQNQNKGKNGKSQSRGEQESESKELANMVAEQEAIRQAMQEYENALKEQGMKQNEVINSIIEEMEKNEKDIINSRVSQETLNRQQKIVTRMLESEKAELQREKDEKRESTEAKNQIPGNPKSDIEYKRKKDAAVEMINFTPVPVNFYYKSKASEYILKIGNEYEKGLQGNLH